MQEVWKDIEGYNGKYQVSNYGRVRSTRFYGRPKIRILNPSTSSDGYKRLTLFADGSVQKQVSVHRLVAEAFIPNPDNLEMVNHKDEVKTNNCVDNLEWCTRSYNQIYSMNLHKERRMVFYNNFRGKDGKSVSSFTIRGVPHSRREKIKQSTYDGKLIRIYNSASEASMAIGVGSSNILNACRRNARTDRVRKRKKKAGAYGFVWEFAN